MDHENQGLQQCWFSSFPTKNGNILFHWLHPYRIRQRQSTKSAAQSTTHFCPVPCPHPGPVIKTTKQIITTDPKNKSYKKDPKWGHYCIISVAQLGQLWVHCPHAGERGRGLNTATLTKLGTTRVMITILGAGLVSWVRWPRVLSLCYTQYLTRHSSA